MNRFLIVLLMLGVSSAIYADETVCPVIADNSIAAHGSEWNENEGSAKRLKIKGSENYPVFKFDLSKIPNDAKIEKVELTIQVTNPKMNLRQIGYSTVPVDWEEGSGAKPDNADHKFSCYKGPFGPNSNWGKPGARFLNSNGGNMGTVAGALLAEKVDGKFKLNLPVRVISAMKKDQIGGLTLSDESGWWGGEFSNIYIHSREAGELGPQLKVTWSKNTDTTAPSAPAIQQFGAPDTDGEVMLEITCGGNDADKGMALGFEIKYSENAALDWNTATLVSRIDTPRPLESGVKIRNLLRDLKPGAKLTFGIKAYDEAGNYSEVKTCSATVGVKKVVATPTPEKITFEVGGPLVLDGLLNLCAVDELFKVEPVTGQVLRSEKYEDSDYKNGNLFWDGKNKATTLTGAKGEFVCFQLVLENISGKSIDAITFKTDGLAFDKNSIPAKNIRFLRQWYLKKDSNWYSNALPILEDKDNGVLSLPYKDNVIEGQKFLALYVEIYVPNQAVAGKYSGSIKVTADKKEIVLPIQLSVLNFEIPPEVNFIIELNAYGVSGKSKKEVPAGDAAAEEAYKARQNHFFEVHKLAHMFRTGYNALGYGHSGSVSVPYIPAVKGMGKDAQIEDWSEWDSWMGPLLTGKLFEDLPRGAVPIPHQYMPIYENYPTPMTEYLGGKLHAKRKELNDDKLFMPYLCENDVLVQDGFSQTWKDGMFKIGQEYRKHFEEKGWLKTEFQLFLNNKVFKGGDKATSMWTLDEPTYGRDFRALGYINSEMKKPFLGTKLKMVIRSDVSRPAAQGNRLDNGVDTVVMSGSFYSDYQFISKRMKERDENYWVYGGGNPQDKDLAQLHATYIKMWRMGCYGGLAYWTSFAGSTWNDLNPLAVVLKGENGYKSKPTASVSLATQRRVQQDIELMTLLSKKQGWNRQMVAEYVDAAVNLASATTSRNAEDPGSIKFNSVSAEQLSKLRICLQNELLK